MRQSVTGSRRRSVPGRTWSAHRSLPASTSGSTGAGELPRTSTSPVRQSRATTQARAEPVAADVLDRGEQPFPDVIEGRDLPAQGGSCAGPRPWRDRDEGAAGRATGGRVSRRARPRAHPGRRPASRGARAPAAWRSRRAVVAFSPESRVASRTEPTSAATTEASDDRDPKPAVPRVARRRRGCVHAARSSHGRTGIPPRFARFQGKP